MNATKTVSFTHLATYRRVGGDRLSLKDRLAQLFQPTKDKLDLFMHQVGLIQNVTYPYINGFSGGSQKATVMPYGECVSFAEVKLDFAKIAADRAAAGQAALGAADVLQLLSVPPTSHVYLTVAEVKLAEGAAALADFGDGADPDHFLPAINLNALASVMSAPATAMTYLVDDTLDLTLTSAGIDKAQVRLGALIFDLRAQR